MTEIHNEAIVSNMSILIEIIITIIMEEAIEIIEKIIIKEETIKQMIIINLRYKIKEKRGNCIREMSEKLKEHKNK